jgi:hypothetical protein
VNGVDKSVWGGLRHRRPAAPPPPHTEEEKKEEKKVEQEKGEESQPGLLQRLKKAILG